MKIKDKFMTRLFSVNCNWFGPGSNDEIDQVVRESKSRNVYGIMVISSDARKNVAPKIF